MKHSPKENLIVNPNFQLFLVGDQVAHGWRIKPERNTFHYEVIEIIDNVTNTKKKVQKITGKGRGDGYVWQRVPVAEEMVFQVTARMKTIGETSAQVWMLFVDEEGKSVERLCSDHVLGNSDWSDIILECNAPVGSKEVILFAISFTVREQASALWESVDIQVIKESNPEIKANKSQAENKGMVIPKPKQIIFGNGRPFRLSSDAKIIVEDMQNKELLAAAKSLQRFMEKKFSLSISYEFADINENEVNTIYLGTSLQNHGRKIPDHQEGYRLEVESNRISIIGKQSIGAFYGVQSLIQLIQKQEDGSIQIPDCVINDWPDLAWRGIHLLMDFQSVDFMKDLIEHVVARYKYNKVVIECSMVKWESHPEIWQAEAATKSELAEVIEFAREHLLEVIPLIQSLGHCQWLFFHDQNLDICEDPETPWCYNPLKARSYEVIFGIMDEAIELFKPAYMHIGHDEVRMRGKFPNSAEGKALGYQKLFVMDTIRIAHHLAQKRVQTMIWADEVQDIHFETYLKELDRDIIMVDWQYHPFHHYQGMNYLMESGFRTIGSTWYDPQNIHTYATYCEKVHGLGLLQTTWTGHFGSTLALNKEIHQFMAYILAAEAAWYTDGYKDLTEVPYSTEQIIQEALQATIDKAVPKWGKSW